MTGVARALVVLCIVGLTACPRTHRPVLEPAEPPLAAAPAQSAPAGGG